MRLVYFVRSCNVNLGVLISTILLACFIDWTFRIFFFCGDLTGNTVIHLDKALARIRDYERMKLKADFNHCNTGAAGLNSSEVSNAERASANPAEGTWSHDAAHVHVQRPLVA